MNELSCYDLNGEPITSFVQWDTGQKIIVDGQFTTAPFVDFSIQSLGFAYRMNSELCSDGKIKVEVPNDLLMYDEAIFMYIYVYKINDDTNGIEEGRTKYINRFSVKQKTKPADYIYVNNVELVSLISLKQSITELENQITNNEEHRKNAETQRISNENYRLSNESNRMNQYQSLVKSSEQIMSNHQDAINQIPSMTADLVHQNIGDVKTYSETAQAAAESVSASSEQIEKNKTNIQNLTERLDSLGLYVDDDGDICQKEN